MTDTFKDIAKLEADLWEAADNLRANSKLTSSDYFMPVLGAIFLRHAANRFEAATRQIEVDQAAGPYAQAQPGKFDPIAEAIRGLIKQVDLLYKFVVRVADLGSALTVAESVADVYDRRAAGRLLKQLDEERKAVVEQLKQVAYFHRQVVWLHERFPNAELEAVPGLVKLVDKQEIDAADWSLTPGRYVDVAPLEEDEEFDFETALRDIHTELADLNQEAVELATRIQANFEGLGV